MSLRDRIRSRVDFSLVSFPGTAGAILQLNPTILLINAVGANNSTSFTDDSSYAHTITTNGTTKVNTGISKFGTSSIDTNTSPYGYLAASYTSAFTDWGSDRWIMEGWFYTNNAASFQALFSMRVTAGTNSSWILELVSGTLYAFVGGGWIQINGPAVSANAWHHVVFQYDGTTFRIGIDGSLSGSYAGSGAFLANTGSLCIGGNQDGSSLFRGYMESIRVQKGAGASLYATTYTVPTERFTS